MMKKYMFSLFILSINILASGQSFVPVDSGSIVKFRIKNFGFDVDGSFSGLKGTINFDRGNLAGGSFGVSVDANSINTGNEMRDNHLKEQRYFDVKNFPRIHLVSTRLTRASKDGTFFISAKLTIKDITKDISFPFTAKASGDGFFFNGEFKMNRKDFGVGGSSTISDNLDVLLEVFAKGVNK
jgi:polyisoprenoid-binding protein YceI